MIDYKDIKNKVWADSHEHEETNDCTVKALALTTGESYRSAHYVLQNLGREHRKGVGMNILLQAYTVLGYRLKKLERFRQPNGSAYTPITAKRVLKRGSYLVEVTGHVLAIVDGHVLDWTEGRRHRIISAYKVVSP